MSKNPQDAPEGPVPPQHPHLSPYYYVQASVDKSLRYVDITAAILLSIATVATAWCAYQSTRWGGVQSVDFAEASTLRLEAANDFNLALTAINYDTITYIEWLDAVRAGDEELAEYVTANLIREEFRPYLEAWLEDADENDLPTPLEDDEYVTELLNETASLTEQAEEKFSDARDANQTGDDYVLATVLFASVLFFAGISTKFERLRVQGGLVFVGFIMLILGIVQIAGLPIQ